MAAYTRLAKDTEMIQWATEIKVRAERQAGAMLAAMPKAQGEKLNGRAADGFVRRSQADTAETTLADIGVSKPQSSRWQSLASMTEEHFETAVATAPREMMRGHPANAYRGATRDQTRVRRPAG